METRILGKTGMAVGILGFGGAEIGYHDALQSDVDRIVAAAMDAGANVFDTAECYQESETKLGSALRDRRDRVFLFTKCGHTSGLEGTDWDPEVLKQSIDRSLTRLQTPQVDLLQLHSCSRELLARGEVVDVLVRAKESGRTQFIGYSGDGADALYAIQSGVFDTLQTSINVADQQAIDLLLPAAREQKMGVIAKRPIANAAWQHETASADAYHYEYWKRLGVLNYPFLESALPSAVSTALRFTLATSGVHVAIVGTRNPDRWQSNTAILEEGPLGETIYNEIRSIWERHRRSEWVGQT